MNARAIISSINTIRNFFIQFEKRCLIREVLVIIAVILFESAVHGMYVVHNVNYELSD